MFQRALQLARYRELILSFVLRDVKEKYQGTVLGYFWALLMPLPTMVVFAVVFTYVLPVRIPQYPLYLLTGILVWNGFFVCLSDSTWSIRRTAELLRKVSIPPEVFPVSATVANTITFCLSFVLLVPFLVIYQVLPSGKLWSLPWIILWQALFSCGLGMTLALVHVYFRDTGHLVEAALGVWFYATPVFYGTDLMSDKVRAIYYLNPTAVMVELYRWSILGKPCPPFHHLIVWAGVTVSLLMLGFWSYKHYGIHVAKHL